MRSKFEATSSAIFSLLKEYTIKMTQKSRRKERATRLHLLSQTSDETLYLLDSASSDPLDASLRNLLLHLPDLHQIHLLRHCKLQIDKERRASGEDANGRNREKRNALLRFVGEGCRRRKGRRYAGSTVVVEGGKRRERSISNSAEDVEDLVRKRSIGSMI